ncbi:MAG: GIY-YIG nuclease family protein [Candidatus Pacebacteria bacterium]|nr:GIY-YIG nuclease family protein [Candidatus Paceibacterota bacterium]
MQYVYILQSQKDKSYYIGSSSNLKNRLLAHNQHTVKSTKAKTPYKLIWYCAFINKETALNFEKYLKTGSGIAFCRKRFLNLK